MKPTRRRTCEPPGALMAVQFGGLRAAASGQSRFAICAGLRTTFWAPHRIAASTNISAQQGRGACRGNQAAQRRPAKPPCSPTSRPRAASQGKADGRLDEDDVTMTVYDVAARMSEFKENKYVWN